MNNTGQSVPGGRPGTPDADIDAPEAWTVFTGSRDVIVCVIDTGVNYNHPDLAANIWTNPGEIAGNGIDDDGNGFIDDIHGWDFKNLDNDPMDDHGHGSHCSGTIGGVGDNGVGVAGVNWQVSIMGCKFLDSGGYGNTADAILAVQYATMMGADVMSNSWGGGPYDQAMYDAIQAAYTANIFFVAAAGNSGDNNDVTPHYPSSYANGNVIAVMATDMDDLPVNEAGLVGHLLRRDERRHRGPRPVHLEHGPGHGLRQLQRHLDGDPARLGSPRHAPRSFPEHHGRCGEEPAADRRERSAPQPGRQVRERRASEPAQADQRSGHDSAQPGHRPGGLGPWLRAGSILRGPPRPTTTRR